MPAPYQTMYELKGTIVDPASSLEREILIDSSTNQAAMQTELTALQTAGVLNDGVTKVKNLVIRTHVMTIGQDVPEESKE